MNRGGIGFAFGLILGSVITYVYSKTVMEKKMTDKINDEIARIELANKKKANKIAKDKVTADAVPKKKAEKARDEAESLEEFAKRRGYYNYATKLKDNTEATPDPDVKMDFSNITAYEDEDEFAKSDFESLTYYYDGEELTDEEGKRANTSFLGDLDLDELFSGKDVVYIRNEILECDYEIIWADDFSRHKGGGADDEDE